MSAGWLKRHEDIFAKKYRPFLGQADRLRNMHEEGAAGIVIDNEMIGRQTGRQRDRPT